MESDQHAIGRPHWRVDGIGKVTGRALFGADLGAPGMLWGKVLLARRPHARVLSIDASRAKDIEGVRAVITDADLPFARTFGVAIKNQPVLAGERVRHYGDAVAMVAAESPQAAEAAIERIAVRYEDLPGVFDPEEALEPGAPSLHGETNLVCRHRVGKGDIEEGFRRARLVLDRTYRTQHVEHAYIEPEAVLAEPADDGGMLVTGSIQNIFSTRRSLAEVLGLDLARVTVRHATLGGSFGGKDEVMTQMACRAALLARATSRPVKMVNDREHSIVESYKRHPYVLHYRVGADESGRLTAIEAAIVADAGAYASMSPFVTWRSAVQATGPYECPNVDVDVRAAYTNNTYTGAMRGFGAPQVNFAIESIIDELACELGIDPIEMRRRNCFKRGSTTATGQRLDHEVSVREALEKAAEATLWTEKRSEIEAENAARKDGRRRGIGIAASYRGVSLGAEGTDAAGAIVSAQTDGSVIISAGLTDMGQGVATALSIIVAEVLGVDTKRIKFLNVDTGRVPDSGPTVASRSTLMGGQAARKAAEEVRATLLATAAEVLRVKHEDLELVGSRAVVRGDPGRGIGFDDLVSRTFAKGRPLLGFGWHAAPPTTWDEEKGRGNAYLTFVYSANVAEVEVDLETGRVELLKMTAAHDVGRAISPAMIRSQVCGGIAMGLGYATLERFALEKGVPTTFNFDDYLIATSLDMPEVETILIENPDRHGPFGAKSVGEPATEIAAPAIANAIAHATGRRIASLPADLETVLLGHPLRKE